jgi:transcriptional regulator with XRE-family HTH domain
MAERLVRHRTSLGLTQREMAARIGVDQGKGLGNGEGKQGFRLRRGTTHMACMDSLAARSVA